MIDLRTWISPMAGMTGCSRGTRNYMGPAHGKPAGNPVKTGAETGRA
jgi:hypothetical protein